MKKSNFINVVITLQLIAFFTTSWVSQAQDCKSREVSITVPFHMIVAAHPIYTYEGPFTIKGEFRASGTAIMVASVNDAFTAYDCMWTLTDDNGGTFTLHEVCQAATMPATGRWEIVGGTGEYKNLRGEGTALMPAVYKGVAAEAWEVLRGVLSIPDRRKHNDDLKRHSEDNDHDE